jgi:hypothetical protein
LTIAKILISASANFLQRLRAAMVFTSSHRDAIDDRFGGERTFQVVSIYRNDPFRTCALGLPLD